MRFFIAAPHYANNSAGVRVLHKLCHLLRLAGEAAYVPTGTKTNSEWATPCADYEPDMIAIYPEVVSGNPLGAEKVVRYVLNYPGKLGGDTSYPAEDCIVTYMDKLYPDAFEYTMDVIEPFFCDEGLGKTHDSYYVGKGLATYMKTPMPYDPYMVKIGRFWPATRYELARLLKTTSNFFTYDPFTALSEEARRCGATVYLVKEDGEVAPHDPAFHPHDDERIHGFINHVAQHFRGRP